MKSAVKVSPWLLSELRRPGCYRLNGDDCDRMKTFSSLGGVIVFCVAMVTAGCAKKETVTSTAPAPDAAATQPAAANTDAMAKSLTTSTEDAKSMLSNLKVPDLTSTSVADLAGASERTLTGLSALAGTSNPEVTQQVDALKTSISANKTTDALSQLKQLAASAQAIPGAQTAIDGTKKMVSAWALKQGFDKAKIAPVLGALQSGGYAGLTSQAATLMGTGGLSDQQKSLLNGVLSTYGLDTKANELLGKAKGLF